MSTQHPEADTYLKRLDAALKKFKLAERAEIVADVRSHIADALSFGKPLPDVLRAFGKPEALARAYAMELALHPSGGGGMNVWRFFRVAMIVAASGFMSLIVALFLGTIAIGFFLSGVCCVILGALGAAGVDMGPHVNFGGMPPIAAVLFGVVLMAIGWGSGWLLWLYARFIARAVSRAMPNAQPATA